MSKTRLHIHSVTCCRAGIERAHALVPSRDVLGEEFGKSVVDAKELPVQQVNRVACFPAAVLSRGRNVNLNAIPHFIVGFDGPQDATHRIGERAVQQILELSVAEYRKKLGGQIQVGVPHFPARRGIVERLDSRQRTIRIVGGDRAADEFFGMDRKSHEQADAAIFTAYMSVTGSCSRLAW